MKKEILVAAVNTFEALEGAVSDGAIALGVENPLYSRICDKIHQYPLLAEYDIEIIREKQIILLLKRRGWPVFDPRVHEIFYLPLTWEDWHS